MKNLIVYGGFFAITVAAIYFGENRKTLPAASIAEGLNHHFPNSGKIIRIDLKAVCDIDRNNDGIADTTITYPFIDQQVGDSIPDLDCGNIIRQYE